MARISGIELEDNQRIDYALTRIRGLGWTLAKRILSDLKVNFGKRVSEITPSEINKISAKVGNYPTEGELTRSVSADIQRLKRIGSYRGVRHTKGLPTRGQRTRSNARTKRGKRKTVGAFKKEMLTRKVGGQPAERRGVTKEK